MRFPQVRPKSGNDPWTVGCRDIMCGQMKKIQAQFVRRWPSDCQTHHRSL